MDADAEQLLTAWAHLFSTSRAPIADAELRAVATRLAAGGWLHDGLVHYCLTKTWERFGERDKVQPELAGACSATGFLVSQPA